MKIPDVALAVRQPWAWAIIHAGKPVENREWKRWKPAWKFRGRVAILASQGMTQAEYWHAADFMATVGVGCPSPEKLIRGAIIGHVEIIDNIWESKSPWFVGPGALVLSDPEPLLTPIPCDGKLDIFGWQPAAREVCKPGKWMLPPPEAML